MKKTMLLVLTLVIVLAFSGCGQGTVDHDETADKNEVRGSTEVQERSPEAVVEEFFLLYSQSDIEGMKQYCSEDFVELYFGTDSVFGNTSATAQKIESVEEKARKKRFF